jgi:hypothetical protein
MRQTTDQTVDRLKLELILLKSELQGYIDGIWIPEYYLTIGYNRVYTGRKKYLLDKRT